MVKYTIGQASKILGVSIDTLRRWDESGKLESQRRDQENEHRYYTEGTIRDYLRDNVFEIASKWVFDDDGKEPNPMFYCSNSSIFQARLSKLDFELNQIDSLKKIASLLIAVTGEIGNNTFDHNLGNFPDVPGLFFGYNIKSRIIVLADRGRGILTTLKRVRPELANDQEALETAFTEVVSGRAPESRGNGLKYTRRIIEKTPISLFFQSGNAELDLDDNSSFDVKKVKKSFRGCLALIKF